MSRPVRPYRRVCEGSRASWRNLTVNVVRSLDRSVTELLFDIAERHAQGFPVPESALTVMAMTSGAAASSADLDLLYRDLHAAHLHPLWRIERNLLTEHPMPRAIPWVWRAADMYPLGERAIRAVPVNRGGERRVLSLGNPGLGGAPYAAGTLWGALQCLGPGETAPVHRHTPGAIRFVLTGTGVWTTVNGDRCDMGPGDLVLTPSWYWHDHTNSGDRAMFWFDGLDLPMVEALDAVFYEQYPEHAQPAAGHNRSGRRSRAIRPGTPRRGHIRAQRPRSRPRCLSTAGRTPTRNWAGWRGSGRKLPASARNSPTPRPAAACCPRWRARCTGWPPIGAAQRSGGPVTPSSSCSAARVAARSAAADWSGPRATCSWFPPGCPPRTDRESARTCSSCRTRPCCARSAYTAKRRFREAPGPDRPPG